MKASSANTSSFEVAKVTLKYDCRICGRHIETELEVPAEFAEMIRDTKKTKCDSCLAAEQKEEELERKRERWRERSVRSGVPEKFLDYDFQKGNRPMLEFISANRERSILLLDKYDSGKTRALAYGASRTLIRSPETRVAFWNFNDLSTRYSALALKNISEAEELKNSIVKNQILVIDDLGKRKLNDTACDLCYSVLNKVYESDCRLWISINKDLDVIGGKFSDSDIGEAVVSRIKRMIAEKRMAVWTPHSNETNCKL